MIEGVPKRDKILTPEQEARKQRYLTNLEHIQESDLSALYPPEMKKQEWVEITDEKERNNEIENLGLPQYARPQSELYGLYRSEDNEHIYIVPRSQKNQNITQLQLDMLATAKEIAPWAKQKGIILESKSQTASDRWSSMGEPWSFVGNLIKIDVVMRENMVNGLGDPQYSHDQKAEFIRQDIAAIVHENTHMNNTISTDFGGPARKITETAPMAAEYLAFPGKNDKMNSATEQARKLLNNEHVDDDYYNDATLIGMLIMASDEGYLPELENISGINDGLIAWQKMVEKLSPEELSEYRRRVESEWLLSNGDKKVRKKIHMLRQQYAQTMRRLIGDHALEGEDESTT